MTEAPPMLVVTRLVKQFEEGDMSVSVLKESISPLGGVSLWRYWGLRGQASRRCSTFSAP